MGKFGINSFDRRRRKNSNTDTADNDDDEEIDQEDKIIKEEQKEDLKRMKSNFTRNPPLAFILNNLILSVQIFKNFER